MCCTTARQQRHCVYDSSKLAMPGKLQNVQHVAVSCTCRHDAALVRGRLISLDAETDLDCSDPILTKRIRMTHSALQKTR